MSNPSALFPPDQVRVTAIKESPRRPGRIVVGLSSGQQCIVGLELVAEIGATAVGATLDAAQVERLLHGSAVTALVDKALAALARGRRTRRELEIRLRRVAEEPRHVSEALDRLEASGLVSDTAVAGAEASARLRRGEAPARVRQRLQRKGIASRTAELAVAEAVIEDGFDERAACLAQASKRWRALSSVPPEVAQRRLIAFLQRRGFSGGVIRSVLGDLRRS